jgi:hypothetical protein
VSSNNQMDQPHGQRRRTESMAAAVRATLSTKSP